MRLVRALASTGAPPRIVESGGVLDIEIQVDEGPRRAKSSP
jgi:hypothetical protein